MRNTISLGRDVQCDIQITEDFDTVSNEHADIKYQSGDLILIDHSTNGTVVNGVKYKGESVSIKKGDEIYLAGKYQVKWDQIMPFFPELQRSTVLVDDYDTLNVRSGRQTMQLDEMYDSKEHFESSKNSGGRVTELRGELENEEDRRPIIPQQKTRKKSKKNKVTLWSVLCAFIIFVAFCLYLFNDIIYNIL